MVFEGVLASVYGDLRRVNKGESCRALQECVWCFKACSSEAGTSSMSSRASPWGGELSRTSGSFFLPFQECVWAC